MKFILNKEPDGTLHFEKHKVSVIELEEFFTETDFIYESRKDGSFLAYGKLQSGRYLKIVYRKLENELYFIITAYDLEDQLIIDYIERELE